MITPLHLLEYVLAVSGGIFSLAVTALLLAVSVIVIRGLYRQLFLKSPVTKKPAA